jgi:LysM repeat protein
VGSLVVVLATAVALVGVRAGAAAGKPAQPRPAVVYTVRAGDTLWGIARSRVGGQEDPRPYVDRLVRANHLAGGSIRIGQRLILPA